MKICLSLRMYYMIGKNSMKHHYLKKNYSHLNMEDITDAD